MGQAYFLHCRFSRFLTNFFTFDFEMPDVWRCLIAFFAGSTFCLIASFFERLYEPKEIVIRGDTLQIKPRWFFSWTMNSLN
jgi:hypothetical protein